MHCGKGQKNSSTVQIQNGITMLPVGEKTLIASKNQTKGGRPKKNGFHSYFCMTGHLIKMNKHGYYFAFRALLPWLQSNVDFTPFLCYFQFLKAENWQKSKFHYM